MNAFRFALVFSITFSFSYADENGSVDSKENTESKADSKETKTYLLNAVTATADSKEKQSQRRYQSGTNISTQQIESNPSGNGDIGSLLRILPNVQFDNSQLRSTTPGEIDPAKISISGGLHYQNLFMIDGMGMNNDLNPAQTGSTWTSTTPGRSQGMAIDTSLLESINVLDSNISASYGGFNGGVIEANLRKPSKKFGAKLSYQITQGNATPGKISMTNYHLYDNTSLYDFLESSTNSESVNNSPIFYKHLLRANIESRINDNFAFITSFSTTQSIIPLRRSDNDYLNTTRYPIPAGVVQDNNGQAIKNQYRAIYNYMLKGYYDINDTIRLELSYTYAPDFNSRYILGGKPDQSYDWRQGGHTLGFKTTWDNALGTLSNTLSYQFLENSTIAHNYQHTKYWRISDSKNWSNWAGQSREGGYAPSNSISNNLQNRILQDFSTIEFLRMIHKIQTGIEISYSYHTFKYTHDYMLAQGTLKIQDADKGKCADEWCDSSKVYAIKTSATRPYTYSLDIWENGQYFNQASLYRGSTILNNFLAAFFIEDDIALPLGKNAGSLNIRPGLRIDTDTYMGKWTFSPRFSINYIAPWSETHKNFATQLTMGANRYYGRNILAYRLRAELNSMQTTMYRNAPNVSWESVLAEGNLCSDYKIIKDADTGKNIYADASNNAVNCIISYKNSVKFSELKVPYVDEYMIGLAQGIYTFALSAKYIHRAGKDEVRYARSDYVNLPSDSNYTSTYYTYTNEGKSWTDVVVLSLENRTPLEFLGIQNFFLFAFDFTNVKRNFTDYASAASVNELEDKDILWQGSVVASSQRPASNFVRPYTIRLSSTHTFQVWKARIMWNNFFRYRSEYDAIVLVYSSTNSRIYNQNLYNPNYPRLDQYAAQTLQGAFSWDMRLGIEIPIYSKNIVFVNLDIFNILDAKNPTIINTTISSTPTLAYEVGRQFYLELGYKW